MLEINSMMTFNDLPAYSHTMAVAPDGRGVPPPPATPTGAGSVIPKADPTLTAVGHERGAWVTAGSVGDATIADGVDAAGVDDAVLELPHAVKTETAANAVITNR